MAWVGVRRDETRGEERRGGMSESFVDISLFKCFQVTRISGGMYAQRMYEWVCVKELSWYVCMYVWQGGGVDGGVSVRIECGG